MKAIINNENKAKFFAQYWGVKCGSLLQDPHEPVCKNLSVNGGHYDYMELTPLSAITDEDAIQYFDILWGKSHQSKSHPFKIEYGKEWALSIEAERFGLIPFGFIAGADFLRSRGYALPWMGLTVDELIAAGWIKLREA